MTQKCVTFVKKTKLKKLDKCLTTLPCTLKCIEGANFYLFILLYGYNV